jgi:penicillin-binding protein 1C
MKSKPSAILSIAQFFNVARSLHHSPHHRLGMTGLLIALTFLAFTGICSFFSPLHTEIPYAQILTDRTGTPLHAFLSSDEKWRMKTELHEISDVLKRALIEKEDRWFYWHFGVNPFAIVRAALNNTLQKRTTSGASTLTMQVARMLENRRSGVNRQRTVGNKLVEILRAFQLELTHSKDEILQLYCNLAPYSGNIEGVKAASLLYFGQSPDKLSLAQATVLAIIPNRPTSLKMDEAHSLIRRERDKWLERFRQSRTFPNDDLDDAVREPLGITRHDVPTLAPHLGYRLTRNFPDSAILRTTIDIRKQTAVQTMTQNAVRRLALFGIHNAAVLVVNNATRGVEAYIGSPDYNDKPNAGAVDGVRAVRSPGSALKPLAYALAMDNGAITPKTMLVDAPVNFDGYAPENFDRTYRGFVTAERALVNSLNIPAVKLVHSLGVAAFTETLTKAGFEQVRKDGRKLGLSSVLGGCGVRLEEMAGLYAAFANYGAWKPLRYVVLGDSAPPTQLISRSAAFMLGEILTQLTRPDVPRNFASTQRLPKVAWKTGTSYGRRDAWSVGYNKRYTVAVWVGNFSGAGVPELVGAEVATPLLFDIFNAIDYNSPNDWLQPPPELDFRLVCAESGLLPSLARSDACQNQVQDYYISSVSSNVRCQHVKEVFVAADEQVSYCTDCVPSVGYKVKAYPNLPPEIAALYTAQNRAFERIPDHNPSCSRIVPGLAPAITSLSDGKEYIVERVKVGMKSGMKSSMKSGNISNADALSPLMLMCNAANDVRTVHWFVNDKFYASAASHERVFFTPERGESKISCTDDKGRTAHVRIAVAVQ